MSAGGDSPQHDHAHDALLQLDGAAFVDAAYLATLGRPADEDGRRSYVAKLAAGESKKDLIIALATSVEGKSCAQTPEWILQLVDAKRGHRHWLWKIWPFKLMLPRFRAVEQDQQHLVHALIGLEKRHEENQETDRKTWLAQTARIEAALVANAASQRDATTALERALADALAQRVAPVENNLAALQARSASSIASLAEALRVLNLGKAASDRALNAIQQELAHLQTATRAQSLQIDGLASAANNDHADASMALNDTELSRREQALMRRLQETVAQKTGAH